MIDLEPFKNKIITIEGGDGTGKDTICELLRKDIPNSIYMHFPNYDNSTGKHIKSILTKEIPFPGALEFQSLQIINRIETLFSLSNLYYKSDNPPEYFIFNRYTPSGLVYGTRDGLSLSLCLIMNSILPISKYTFILSGKNYRLNSNEHYETREIQEEIKNSYLHLSHQFNWIVIDNDNTPVEIVKKILWYIK